MHPEGSRKIGLRIGWLVLLSQAPAASAVAGPPPAWDLGLAVLSTGTWTVYDRLDGFRRLPFPDGLERYEFNKILAVGLYGKILGLPAYAGLPLHWSAKRRPGEDSHRVAPGDLEFYLGKRLGAVEARVGGVLPAGYDRRDGNPWIGPGNVQVTAGAAVNPNLTRHSRRWEASAEAKWAYALDDGVAKAGSWGLFPSAKLAFRPAAGWKLGGECLGHWKSSYWGKSASFSHAVLGWGGPSRAQWGAGIVPILFLERFFRPGAAVGGKAGHSLWGYRDAISYNASLYLLYFPR